MEAVMALNDTLIRNAKPRHVAYKLADEKGLTLLVNPKAPSGGAFVTESTAAKKCYRLACIRT
jgi:hypothetical protein